MKENTKLFHKIPVVLLKRKLLVHKILRDEELNINTGFKKREKKHDVNSRFFSSPVMFSPK